MFTIAWAFINTKLGRVIILAGLIVVAFGWYTLHVRNLAVQAERVRQQYEEAERVRKATQADDAARRCATDPRCRLLNDGWRRD